MADHARDRLAARGHDVRLAATSADAEGAALLAKRAAEEGADRVVAIGGDGTAAEAGAGLLSSERKVPLAIVAGGTANVLALNLGIPRQLDLAIAVAEAGEPVAIDAGRMLAAGSRGSETFLISVGTGLHAEIVARADRAAKRRWGIAAYGLAGWKANRATVPVRYRITCDGEAREIEATMVQVMNCGALFRPRWELAPGASPVDGVFDVLVYRAATLPQYLTAAAHVVRGTPTGTELVEHRRGARVLIEGDPVVPLQRDGELAGTSPAEVVILPRALPVVMPVGGPWTAGSAR